MLIVLIAFIMITKVESDVENICKSERYFQNAKLPNKFFSHRILKDEIVSKISQYVVIVNDNPLHEEFPHFWKSAGLCPPDPHQESFKFFSSNDMKQNLFYIGSLPQNGIEQVRIHWLLDLVQLRNTGNGDILFDFVYLDELMHNLWKNNLRPMFELMGNPSDFFTNFENHTQVFLWRDLIFTLAQRYINLFGSSYVEQWKFETWNEPDHHDFDGLNFTVQGFLNYYDACSEGLKLANKKLKFGGPGGSCRIPSAGHSPICWALLDHCIRGKNFFSSETGTRLDFISIHKKGDASSLLIINEEIETFTYIQENFPQLAHLPFYNDESDPLKNWSLREWWRADVTYAAMVVKNILNHIHLYYGQAISSRTNRVNYSLLSNDNAFLSYFPNQFSQRTLLARFQINNTEPKHTEFIKKPVYAIMGLLSKQCHTLLNVQIYKNGKPQPLEINATVGVSATMCRSSRKKEAVVVLYNTADTYYNNEMADIQLIFNSSTLNVSNARWLIYEVNNDISNPFAIWTALGQPSYPTLSELTLIKLHEAPHTNHPLHIAGGPPYILKLKVPNPGVALIHICEIQHEVHQVENVQFLKIWYRSLDIAWHDKQNRCIQTYNIEYSSSKNGVYIQLNKNKVVYPSFWYACLETDFNCTIQGYYRINAMDFWGRLSPYTKPKLLI